MPSPRREPADCRAQVQHVRTLVGTDRWLLLPGDAASRPPLRALPLAVVVPTRNRPVELGQCLGSIAAVPTPGLREIIVVDDASSQPVEVDLPLAVPVRAVRNGVRRGAAASRNTAGQLVDADAIAFLDDDAVVFDDWFWVAQRRLLRDRAAITGRVLPIRDRLRRAGI